MFLFLLKRNYSFTFFLCFYLLFQSVDASALVCTDIRKLVIYYLKTHYSKSEFDDKLNEQTLDNFLKVWDPAKNIFLQSDIDTIKANLLPIYRDQISKGQCSSLDEIYSVYSTRFEEVQKIIKKHINETKHDFTVDEYLDLDRKKMTYAKDFKEINERWRKRIKFQFMQLSEAIDSDDKIREKLNKRYDLSLKRHKGQDVKEVYGSFVSSFAKSLDPHTDYLKPQTLEDFRIKTKLSLEGIGAILRSEDGITTIQSIIPGGAASKTKEVYPDDQIVSVAQGKGEFIDIIDMDLREVVNYIRGPRGTEVRLAIRRDGKSHIVSIIREKIELEDSAAKSFTYDIKFPLSKKGSLKIGVIDLPSFYMDFEGRQNKKQDFVSSSRDVEELINKLKVEKVDGIIVDLRSNGGGSLDEAIKISGFFNGKGPVVQTKGNHTAPDIKSYNKLAIYKGPVVFMIDRQSASASEIVTGAIKDYKRGLVVGDSHSFGKGTVQNLIDLDMSLGAIKVTTHKFYRPDGSSTQREGVSAHIPLPSVTDHYYEIGEKYYQNSLPWESISKISHTNYNLVDPYLEKLQDASKDRVAKNEDYQELFKSIKEFEKKKSERWKVSLKKEKDEKENPKETTNTLSEKSKDENSKDKKSKDEKPKDKLEEKFEYLQNDIALLETINITADYVKLIQGETILPIVISGFKPKLNKAKVVRSENKETKAKQHKK